MLTLFIADNFGVIGQLCEKVIVVYAGEDLEQADTVELLRNSLHPYAKALIECIPRRESIGKN
ncbi:hypothetical protein DRN63_02445 [Nanoarchaeota archaeon]|nr:MAG: hypothetical protein DRN63_02445 [Nanoarchaeota archaeon]